jgi:hypothetical protein
VLSERSGSTVEESQLSDVVAFVNTDDLADVALSLLRNPKRRLQLERAAIASMLQDHNQAHVQTSVGKRASSLALLAEAVSKLAGEFRLVK